MAHRDIRQHLAASLHNAFPQVQADETEAVVSHWLQSPTVEQPFLTRSMRELLCSLFSELVGDKEGPRDGADGLIRSLQLIDWSGLPFRPPEEPSFRFIDLFAGIGGFRIAMQDVGGACVFSSEWDAAAKTTYDANFGEVPYGDVRQIVASEIASHDVLCAGFPCQPFSLAGVSARNSRKTAHGFACETQGTLFFDIARIVQEKRPRVVFLENVKNLLGHDGGRTFAVVQSTMESLGYSFAYSLVDASSLVPQRRVRCYMVCLRDTQEQFQFPVLNGNPLPLRTVLESDPDDSYTISDRLWEGHQKRTARNIERGTGFTAYTADLDRPSNTLVARYGKDGKECLVPQGGKNPRLLTIRECARLQGFPESFVIPVAKTSAYRQFGNSVAVPVVRRISESIRSYLETEMEGSVHEVRAGAGVDVRDRSRLILDCN